jgi:hypothetical protein
MTAEPLPGLRVVVAWSERRNLCSIIVDTLEALAGPSEVRKLSDEAYVVHTALTAAGLRDRLRESLIPGEGVFVADFEVWSGHGDALDARWLLARGH